MRRRDRLHLVDINPNHPTLWTAASKVPGMVHESQFNSALISAAKNLPTAFGLYAGAKTSISSDEIENKFALLKEESARTLALIGRLRASPLYRLSSFDPR
jgi:hypothetical protein